MKLYLSKNAKNYSNGLMKLWNLIAWYYVTEWDEILNFDSISLDFHFQVHGDNIEMASIHFAHLKIGWIIDEKTKNPNRIHYNSKY